MLAIPNLKKIWEIIIQQLFRCVAQISGCTQSACLPPASYPLLISFTWKSKTRPGRNNYLLLQSCRMASDLKVLILILTISHSCKLPPDCSGGNSIWTDVFLNMNIMSGKALMRKVFFLRKFAQYCFYSEVYEEKHPGILLWSSLLFTNQHFTNI